MEQNKKVIDNERWLNLLTSKDYQVIRDYWNDRKRILNKQNLELASNLNFDNTIKIGNNMAIIREIELYIGREKFKENELANKKEKADG